jgi:hypothetical protein
MPPDFARRTTEMRPFLAVEGKGCAFEMERLAAALSRPR